MNINIFNISLLLGWLLVLVGSVLVNVGLGLAISGVLLIALTLFVARLAGVFAPKAKEEGSD